MDETIFFPSPNWFQPAGLVVSTDEWVVYGGPSKSLCVLEPLPPDYDTLLKERQGYTAHVVTRAHLEKIVAVDLCPEWPEKRCILTGSADGVAKQWSLEKVNKSLAIKSTHSHEIHSNEKEEMIGVGYCKDGYAVTVGSFGNIVKWDLNSNVAKNFNHVLKSFKPVTMACSPHIHMHVAIGTKQGVLFVLDLNGSPRIVYKVRGQDDEIVKVSWCPQYEVAVRKALKESDRRSTATERLRKIQQQPEAPETLKLLDEKVKNSQTTEQPVLMNEKCEPVTIAAPSPETLNESGIGKDLPEDSFDESVVQEDDMFDIYKDHEPDEFGHKKFQPVDVLVRVTTETVKEDYLTECLKLKEEILQRKAQADAPIGELVEAMEKTQIEAKPEEPPATPKSEEPPATPKPEPHVEGKITKGEVESSVHIHKHLLATVSKQGSIRVWSKTGKMVGSCHVTGSAPPKKAGKRSASSSSTTLLWARPDELLIADGNNQLLNCNPLRIDCKNKLEWTILHRNHLRGMFAIGCSAPRAVQPGQRREPAAAWTTAQDRILVRFCLDTARMDVHMTCGGFLYTVKPCPYDAGRVSVSVGDGHVRVWEAEYVDERLRSVSVQQYWQNVQGKILVTAWHPRKENLLAFATAEARVGLIDTSRPDKAAAVLQPSINGSIYSISWGADDQLYACGAGSLVLYDTRQRDQAPTPVTVVLEGAQWEVSMVEWYPWAVVVGSNAGAVAVLDHAHTVQAAAFVFTRMVYMVEWSPFASQCTGEECPRGDLLAACSLAKPSTVAVLKYTHEEDGSTKLSLLMSLSGHKDTVHQVSWSPHHQHLLLSTSQDGTVRIWNIDTASCVSIFGGHVTSSLGATWLNWPSLSGAVLSGGTDCALRLWKVEQHAADQYQALKYEVCAEKKGKKNKREREEKRQQEESGTNEANKRTSEEQAVAALELKRRYNKRFLLPTIDKQSSGCDWRAPRKMFQKFLERNGATVTQQTEPTHGLEFIDLFGNINEVNHLLDNEMEWHMDTGNEEAWAILGILRGTIDTVIQRAAARDTLDPLLLSVAPCVSFKYWKDATLLYLQQIDRLIAKGEEHKLAEAKQYGGALYRKVVALLSLHDVKGAVSTLCDARLYKEALVLSRTRYMDSLADQTLQLWAQSRFISGNIDMSAVCYIALGNLSAAATVLGKSTVEESLQLAGDIAHVLGQNTLAGHIHEKRHKLRARREQDDQETKKLEELPTRAELILNEAQMQDEARALPSDAATPTSDTQEEEKPALATPDETKDQANKDTETSAINATKDQAKVTETSAINATEDQAKDTESNAINATEDQAKDTKTSAINATKDQAKDTKTSAINATKDQGKDTETSAINATEDQVKDSETSANNATEDQAKVTETSAINATEDQAKDTETSAINATKDQAKDTKTSAINATEDQAKDVKDEASNLDKEITDPENEVQDPVDDLKDQEKKIVGTSGDNNITDKTEEILAKLPEKMEGLFKESVPKDFVPNGTHKGEGDTIQNGAVGDEIRTKVSEKGDEVSQTSANDNVI